MRDVVFVTGNSHKIKYFSEMVGFKVPNLIKDIQEVQSSDIREVIEYKAKQAYDYANQPILVEDTRLSFQALGGLPGTFIKWFLADLGVDGLCKMLNGFSDRSAVAGAAFAYYDGKIMKIFEKELIGKIAKKPKGSSGFGWNSIFKPDGTSMTLGEMDEDEFKFWYAKIKPFQELKDFLKNSN